MTYREAVTRLYSLERWGIKLGLDNIRLFCKDLGNPQDNFQTIHIAGTNGKGSVTAIGFAHLFIDASMGFHWLPEPEAEVRDRYDVLYGLLRTSLPTSQAGPVPSAAPTTGS